MDDTKKQECRIYLTGYTPRDWRGREFQPPTANDIKNYILQLSPIEMRKISDGPYGRTFRERSNQALRELAEKENTIRTTKVYRSTHNIGEPKVDPSEVATSGEWKKA